jgi:pyruvate formate lyase activating enzyme
MIVVAPCVGKPLSICKTRTAVIGSKYCRNCDISQSGKIVGVRMNSQEVVNKVLNYEAQGIANTYNKPSIFIEFGKGVGSRLTKRISLTFCDNRIKYAPKSVPMVSTFFDCPSVDFKGSGNQEFVIEVTTRLG